MTTGAPAGTAYVDLVPRLSPKAQRQVDDTARKLGERLATKFSDVGDKFTQIGGKLTTRLTLPLAAGMGAGVIAADKLQGKLREVVSLTGETGTVADKTFGLFQNYVRNLSGELGIAQQELAGGLYQALSAGVPRDNAFTFLQVAGKAAIAGVTDVETSIDGLTTILNAFGLESDQVQNVADSMFTTVKGGKTTFAELSDAIFNVAPLAASVGVKFTEVNAALATLTAAGVPTSVAATGIRAALSGLLRPTEELTSVFQEAGYESAQAALEQVGLAGAFDIVNKATKGNVGELQTLVGSIEGVQAIQTLTGTGAEKFATELENQAKAAGATNAAFQEIDKSRSIERLKTSATNLGIAVGNILLPFIRQLADTLTPLAANFSSLDPSIQKIIVGVGLLAAALGPLNLVLGGLFKSLGLIAGHPIIALVIALAAAFIYAYKNIEPFRETVDNIVASLTAFAEDAAPVIADFGEKVGHYIHDVILPALADFVDFIVNKVAPVVAEYAGRLIKPFSKFASDISDRWQKIQEAIRNALAIISAVIGVYIEVYTRIWRTFGDNILGILKAAFEQIVGVIRGVLLVITGIIDVFIGIFTLDWERAWQGIQEIFLGVWTQFSAIIEAAFDVIWELVSAGVTILAGILDLAWDGIKAAARAVWDAIFGFVRGFIERAVELFLNWTGPGLLIKHFDTIKEAARNVVDAVIRFFRELPGKLLGIIGDIGRVALEAGKTIIRKLLEGLGQSAGFAADVGKAIANAAVDFINSQIIDRINDALEFSIPNPLPGDNDFDIDPPDLPHIPRLHGGGFVTGPAGGEVLAVLEVGEEVIAKDDAGRGRDGKIADTINLNGITDSRDAVSELSWMQYTRGR